MEFASYITGFVDGEGTFSVSFSHRRKLKTNIEVRPSFSISQHKRSLKILQEIQNYFGVGYIRYSKRDQNYKYEVRAINDLIYKIIPHFERFQLKTSKSKDFKIFVIICKMVLKNYHKNPIYLQKIINLAYQTNEGGKRKYNESELLKLLVR